MSGKSLESLDVVHPDCAGIDVGKRKHYVAVDPSRFEDPVRSFGSFTDDLEEMSGWLGECGVRTVALESTGVYWIPMFEVLDRAGFDVQLVNPRATKQVSGRKSDVLDCQWIRQLMSYGLLRGAFRVQDELCPLRSYVRNRSRLVRQRSRSVQHIQKALTLMNVQLDNVLSDVMGKTGQLIVRAIVSGERDGASLARFRDRRCKADRHTIARSLRGNWREEHLFALRQALDQYDVFQRQIDDCEERINAELDRLGPESEPPDDPSPPSGRAARERLLRKRLHGVLGVDLTAIPTIGVETALTIASELGPDLSAFPTSAHFCSWLGVAPGTRISGDKRLRGRTPRQVNRVGQALRMAATTARNNKTAIGVLHRNKLVRKDTARAVKATAHLLARIIYAMITKGEEYAMDGFESLEEQRKRRQLKNLKRQARRLNLTLVPVQPAA